MLPRPNCLRASHRFASWGSNGTPGENHQGSSSATGRTCPIQPENGILLGRNPPSHLLPQAPSPLLLASDACQAAGTVPGRTLSETSPEVQGQVFDTISARASTLELRRPQCKHTFLPGPSHHCRASLIRGGQGHQRLGGAKDRGLEAGSCRNRSGRDARDGRGSWPSRQSKGSHAAHPRT